MRVGGVGNAMNADVMDDFAPFRGQALWLRKDDSQPR
jgi:hypothetical protein